MMDYVFRQYQVRKYLRMNKKTFKEEIVSVSNVNGLSVEKHMELLNLYDDEYDYLDFIGDVES